MTDVMTIRGDEGGMLTGFLEIHVDRDGNRFLLWDDETGEYVRLTEGAAMKEVDRVQLYPNDRSIDNSFIDVKNDGDPVYSPEQIVPFIHDKETASLTERSIEDLDHTEEEFEDSMKLSGDPDLYQRVNGRPVDTGVPGIVNIPSREATSKESLI